MFWFRSLIELPTRARWRTPPQKTALLLSRTQFSTDVAPETGFLGLGPTMPSEKPKVVVLGSGWSGCRILKDLNTKFYDVVCVSPKNHMVFTPLLASTCVGTLEFRSVTRAHRTHQPAISTSPRSYFFLSKCTGINPQQHLVQCETLTDGLETLEPWRFNVPYDKLVIALGAEASTFGIHGVAENATFLCEVHHAQEIEAPLESHDI